MSFCTRFCFISFQLFYCSLFLYIYWVRKYLIDYLKVKKKTLWKTWYMCNNFDILHELIFEQKKNTFLINFIKFRRKVTKIQTHSSKNFRPSRWSWRHHVCAEYQLAVRSQNGTKMTLYLVFFSFLYLSIVESFLFIIFLEHFKFLSFFNYLLSKTLS